MKVSEDREKEDEVARLWKIIEEVFWGSFEERKRENLD